MMDELMAAIKVWDTPVASKIVIGSMWLLETLRAEFGTANSSLSLVDRLSAVPVVLDPAVGRSAIEVWDQNGRRMMRLHVPHKPTGSPVAAVNPIEGTS